MARLNIRIRDSKLDEVLNYIIATQGSALHPHTYSAIIPDPAWVPVEGETWPTIPNPITKQEAAETILEDNLAQMFNEHRRRVAREAVEQSFLNENITQ